MKRYSVKDQLTWRDLFSTDNKSIAMDTFIEMYNSGDCIVLFDRELDAVIVW